MISWLKKNWQRVGLGVLLFLLLSPFLIWGIASVVINTDAAKKKIAQELAQQAGGAWEIDSVSWHPLKGIDVHDVTSREEGLSIRVKRAHISPQVEQALEGKLVFDDIVVDEVEVVADVESLKQKLNGMSASLPAEMQPPKEVKKPPVTKPQVKPRPQVQPEAPQKVTKPVPKKPVEVPRDRWLRAKGVKLQLEHQGKIFASIEGMELALPFSGKDRKGRIAGSLKLHIPSELEGEVREIVRKFEIKPDWVKNQLIWKKTWKPADASYQSEITVVANARHPQLPFRVDYSAVVSKQLAYQLKQAGIDLGIELGQAAAKLQLAGLAKQPNTVRGSASLLAHHLVIHEPKLFRRDFVFDRRNLLVARLSSAGIRLDNLKMQGHDLSIMANGVLTSKGYTYGIVRTLTTGYEMKYALERAFYGTRFLQESPRRMKYETNFLRPLDTPDVNYFDLQVEGGLKHLEMKLPEDTEWESVWKYLERLYRFAEIEYSEEGVKIPHLQTTQ